MKGKVKKLFFTITERLRAIFAKNLAKYGNIWTIIANFHKSLQILALSYLPFSNVVVVRGVAVGGCYCLLVVEWRYQVLAVECWVLAVNCRCRLLLTFSIVGAQLCRNLKEVHVSIEL